MPSMAIASRWTACSALRHGTLSYDVPQHALCHASRAIASRAARLPVCLTLTATLGMPIPLTHAVGRRHVYRSGLLGLTS